MRKEIFVPVGLIGLAVFVSFLLAVAVYAADITSITVTPSDAHATAKATYTINFRLPNDAATTTKISFTFPSGFGVSGAGPTPISINGMEETFDLTVAGQVVTLATTSVGSATSSETQSVQITGIDNPQQDGSYTLGLEATTTPGVVTGTSPAFYIQRAGVPAPADKTAPVSKITRPVSGELITAGQPYTIYGTGTDNASAITKMEVSLDGGQTWAVAQVSSVATPIGASYNWSYVWQNPTEGEYTIRVWATDSAGNIESPAAGVKVTVPAAVVPAVPPEEVPEVVPEKPITEMTVQELQTKVAELQQTLINLLQQLVQLLQQQVQRLLS